MPKNMMAEPGFAAMKQRLAGAKKQKPMKTTPKMPKGGAIGKA